MQTITSMSRLDRIREISARDGILCFHPDCRKPFKNLTSDLALVKENLPLLDDITFDHWFPRSLGGTWDVENLRLMHKRCNSLKGDKVPNEDGTIPGPRSEETASMRRARAKASRIEVCKTCMSGRNLGPDEYCDVCGAVPMPFRHPQWAKLNPNDCEHEGVWWCWCCMSGVVERKPAILDVLAADTLG